jgi:hypothetical protein
MADFLGDQLPRLAPQLLQSLLSLYIFYSGVWTFATHFLRLLNVKCQYYHSHRRDHSARGDPD